MSDNPENSAPPEVNATGHRRPRSFVFYSCGCMVLAFGSLLVLAATIGIIWAYVPSARWNLAAAMSEHHAFHARIYEEALAGGDAALAYQRSDDRLKAAYSEEQLADYFQAHPEVFQLPDSVSMTFRGVNGEQFRSTSFNDQHGKRTEIFVRDSNGQLQLLGIAPNLEDGIPKEVRNFEFDGDVFGGDLF